MTCCILHFDRCPALRCLAQNVEGHVQEVSQSVQSIYSFKVLHRKFFSPVGLSRFSFAQWKDMHCKEHPLLYKDPANWFSIAGFFLNNKDDMGGKQGNFLNDPKFHMAQSTFCLVLSGSGWTWRLKVALLCGCIPVVIADNVEVNTSYLHPYSGILTAFWE